MYVQIQEGCHMVNGCMIWQMKCREVTSIAITALSNEQETLQTHTEYVLWTCTQNTTDTGGHVQSVLNHDKISHQGHCPNRAVLHNIAVCHNGKLLNHRLVHFSGLLTHEKYQLNVCILSNGTNNMIIMYMYSCSRELTIWNSLVVVQRTSTV